MKKIFLLFFLLPFVAAMTGCQQSSQVAENTTEKVTDTAEGVYLKAEVKSMLDQYFVLKDALVATNATSSATAATGLLQIIAGADAARIPGADAPAFNEHVGQLKTAAGQIATESDIEAQRAAFEQATEGMLALVKAFKPGDEAIYYQFCPMAFDFKGAHWLSNEKEIMNPYFGDKMLHCGKVEAEI